MTRIVTILLIALCISQANLFCMDHYTRAMCDGSQRMPKIHNSYYESTHKKHSRNRAIRTETVDRKKERSDKYSKLESLHN